MVAILDDQIQSLERAADAVAPAGRSGDETARAMEELSDVGVALFNALQRVVDRWQDRARHGAEAMDPADARELESLYRRLAGVFDRAAPVIDALERSGQRVAGADSFRQARRELLGLTSLSVDRVLSAERQVQRGESRLIGEVMRELRDRHLA
jgi:hypothetical protein